MLLYDVKKERSYEKNENYFYYYRCFSFNNFNNYFWDDIYAS